LSSYIASYKRELLTTQDFDSRSKSLFMEVPYVVHWCCQEAPIEHFEPNQFNIRFNLILN